MDGKIDRDISRANWIYSEYVLIIIIIIIAIIILIIIMFYQY